jgi:hypothetical protein
MGAPLPSAFIEHPGDELRIKRVVSPYRLAYWIRDITETRGMPVTIKQALYLVYGEADYGLDT